MVQLSLLDALTMKSRSTSKRMPDGTTVRWFVSITLKTSRFVPTGGQDSLSKVTLLLSKLVIRLRGNVLTKLKP